MATAIGQSGFSNDGESYVVPLGKNPATILVDRAQASRTLDCIGGGDTPECVACSRVRLQRLAANRRWQWLQLIHHNGTTACWRASYTYRPATPPSAGNDFNNPQVATVDIGTCVACTVIVAVDGQGGLTSISSLTVNGTPLTQRVLDSTGGIDAAGIFDGVVTGTGPVTVSITWNAGSFLDRNFYLWTATGLTTGYVASGFHNGTGTESISANAGDFVFAVRRQSTMGNWTSSSPTLGPECRTHLYLTPILRILLRPERGASR
jgi:hypothetical protein